MKYYNQFINQQKYEIELNEGLFDMFKKLFNKINQSIIKTKGGKEVESIYQKYINLINQEFQKQGLTELNIGDSTKQIRESNHVSKYHEFLNEAEETLTQEDESEEIEKNKNITIQKLKQKSQVLRKIIDTYKVKALKEMDMVLKKYGGSEKNPKLSIIINNKKDQFVLDFLNAELAYLEKAGDKTLINNVRLERDKLSKDLDAKWKDFDKTTTVELNVKINGKDENLTVGELYRYKKDDGTIKSIKIIGKSEEDGTILASYINGDTADKEQKFRLDNIDVGFEPKKDEIFKYYSLDSKKEFNVKIDEYKKGDTVATVHVVDDDGNGDENNKIKVKIGTMSDLVKDAKGDVQKTEETQKSEEDQN